MSNTTSAPNLQDRLVRYFINLDSYKVHLEIEKETGMIHVVILPCKLANFLSAVLVTQIKGAPLGLTLGH